MAVSAFIEQVIVFISATETYDQNAILANNLIQSLVNNSAGNDIVFGYKQYANIVNGVITYSSLFEIRVYIQPSFQQTVQNNIANLQAAFPQYTIETWGSNTQFGH